MEGEKSAEGIVAYVQAAKARTWKSGGTDTLSDEADAYRKAEMPEDSRRRIGDGIPERTGRERQTPTAAEDISTPETMIHSRRYCAMTPWFNRDLQVSVGWIGVLTDFHEPPYAERHVRCCERWGSRGPRLLDCARQGV